MDTEVQVALITAAAAVLVAAIGIPVEAMRRRVHRTEETVHEVRQALGTPNGHGDLSEMVAEQGRMMAALLAGQAEQDRRHARTEAHQIGIRGELAELRRDVDTLNHRVGALERRHQE